MHAQTRRSMKLLKKIDIKSLNKKRSLLWLLNVGFMCAAFYYLYIQSVIPALSMLFCSIYLQSIIKIDVLEEKVDYLLSTESKSS